MTPSKRSKALDDDGDKTILITFDPTLVFNTIQLVVEGSV